MQLCCTKKLIYEIGVIQKRGYQLPGCNLMGKLKLGRHTVFRGIIVPADITFSELYLIR